METFLIILGCLLALIILVYFFSYSPSIFKSKYVSRPGVVEGDHYYHLPLASMSLKVTATIQYEKNISDNSVQSPKLIQMSFSPEIKIEPDSRALIAVRYVGNWFSSDEVNIKTSSSLLSDISAVTEDRIGAIVSKITEAPIRLTKEFIAKRDIAPFVDAKSITIVIEVTRLFEITAKELEDGEISRNWTIPIEDLHFGVAKLVPADFKLKSNKKMSAKILDNISYDGLLTRPLIDQKWELETDNSGQSFFTCMIPDTESLIKVPVRRAYFVKKQQLPKFNQGLLIENKISKPSEIEAFVSIPINIAKAIVSIPAQLLQFKIIRVRQEKEYEEALADLYKSKEANVELRHAKEIKELSDKIFELKKAKETRWPELAQEGVAEETRPALGKLPPAYSVKNVFSFREDKELLISEEISLTAPFPPELEIPEAKNWSDKLNEDEWHEYDNIKSKTCVPAAAAHLITCWTSNMTPRGDMVHSLDDVIAALKAVAPLGDISRGCRMQQFMDHWESTGIKSDRIDQFTKFKSRDAELLKWAVYWFGGCMIGLQLPDSAWIAFRNKSNTWEFPSDNPSKDKRNWGGHTVCVLGYDKSHFIVVSWGRIIKMSHSFYSEFNDESYIALSRMHWTSASDRSPTNAQLGFNALKELMHQFPNS
jgi:hypothetical protein